MNLAPSADQLAIAAVADDFLATELPISRRRELAADVGGPAIDDRTWARCASLGWLALGLPDEVGGVEVGGVGLGLPEEVMLFRECGRHLAPGPFLSSALGARVAASAGAEEVAAAIASGERRVGLAVGELAVDVRPGDLVLVLDGGAAELFEVESAERVAGIDPGTRFARIVTGSPVARIEQPSILDRARVLVAAQQLGIIEAVRDMSAAYARTRTQFDRPIGTFQAVKHRCADMAVAAHAAIGEVFQAALLVDAGTTDAAFHAATAYVLATNGAKASAADNIQNHGGIGFTWEQDSHLYLKRAFLLEHVLGEQRAAYETVLTPERHEFL
jgi:alkylation response protein AidB-like acyl-CoA dehydrogenase